ncbi:MAG: thiamine phosphate synthase [Bryobacteraceae bacterium]|nr:thiamine phosphate synthase [Bryobacteraceae bacterium]
MLPRFYPIVDTQLLDRRGFDAMLYAATLIDEGARILQIRHKARLTRSAFELITRIRTRAHDAGVLCIINDRADVAAILNAGLHLGQDDLPPALARRVAPSALTGFSTHNEAQAARAAHEPIDYLAIGPVFETSTKDNPDPVIGTSGVTAVRKITHLPLVAIGGITAESAPQVLAAGAASIAVIGDLAPEGLTLDILRERIRIWLEATK